MDQEYIILIISINILKVFLYILAGISIKNIFEAVYDKTPGSEKMVIFGNWFKSMLFFANVYKIVKDIKLLLEINDCDCLKNLSLTIQQPPKCEFR